MVRTFFSRRYILITLLVLLAMAVMMRLGVWQLDRRQQRIARNADLIAKTAQPPVSVNEVAAGLVTLPQDRDEVRDIPSNATGEFDFDHQVILVQQVYHDNLGSRLVTPLRLAGSDAAILVDRGWIPSEDSDPARWAQYDTDPGPVTVDGLLQPEQRIGRLADTTGQQPVRQQWYQVDIAAIAAQMPYAILPVYLIDTPDAGEDLAAPFRTTPEMDLSEGPHLGYALQWFAFAIVAGVIYVRIVAVRTKKSTSPPDAAVSLPEEPIHG